MGPSTWHPVACAYVLLSKQPYAAAAEDARARGWPTAALRGAHHLSAVSDPQAVLGALLDLERALVKPPEASM